jgi:hypothetical protein
MKEFTSCLSNVQPKSPLKGGLWKGGARKILQLEWILQWWHPQRCVIYPLRSRKLLDALDERVEIGWNKWVLLFTNHMKIGIMNNGWRSVPLPFMCLYSILLPPHARKWTPQTMDAKVLHSHSRVHTLTTMGIMQNANTHGDNPVATNTSQAMSF